MIVVSAIAAIVPVCIYLFSVWWFDKYDREPFGLILRNFLWGAVGAIIISVIGSYLLSFMFSYLLKGDESRAHIEAVVIAPVVEEIVKGIFLFLTIYDKKFDNITDGIVYGAAIGLGFGMTENFFYFIAYGRTIPELLTLIVIRTLFSAVMHGVSTATLGAFLAYAKFKSSFYKIIFPPLGLGLAMFIHFMWNLSVSFTVTAGLGFSFLMTTVTVFIAAFYLSIEGEKKIIYSELIEEAESGLIPRQHLLILNSGNRNRHGWIDEKIRKLYINAATTLAFRKRQLKSSTGFSRFQYEKDIQFYRYYIKSLLTNFPASNES